MTRRVWRRAGPWVTPVLVVAEIILVASGLLDVRTALVTGLAADAVLWVIVLYRVVVAVRRYRSSRQEGLDGWAAAEDGLARLVPRPAARLLLMEPRLVVCVARWVSGRHEAAYSGNFSYHRGIRPLLAAVVMLVVFEGAAVEAVLALMQLGTPWIWIALGVHLYALIWLAGFYASMIVRPHLLRPEGLVVRDGIFTELVIPSTAVEGARVVGRSNSGRSGFKVDRIAGDAVLAVGDANVTIDLDPTQPLQQAHLGRDISLRTLHITVDRPAEFAAGVRASFPARSDEVAARQVGNVVQ